MKFSIKTLLLFVFGIAVVGSIVYAFMPQPIPVDLSAIARGTLRVTVDEDGRTRIKERYVVFAPLTGRLMRIEMEPGDSVSRGLTLLATIRPSNPELLDARSHAEAEARVKVSEAALKRSVPIREQSQVAMDFAESELGRANKMVGSGAITDSDLESRQTDYRARVQEFRAAKFAEEIARFELEMAKAALVRSQPDGENPAERIDFEIHAPITGRILNVYQESATIVQAGTRLLEIGNPKDLEVEIDVLSSDAVKIQPDAIVILERWGGEHPLEGRVRLVEPQAFTKVSALGVEEQRANVIVDFVDPPEKRKSLGDGYRVEARIVVWEQDDVLKVPTSSLFRDGEDWAVFAVDDGRARLQKISIGRQNSLEAEILEGLNEHSTVILHPSDKITDGTTVVRR